MFIDEFVEKNEDIKLLLDIYKEEFREAYKKLKKNQTKKKKAIIRNSQWIFMKWYFSSLIDNTYFSPANIINRIVYERYGGESVVLPNITPIFIENEIRDFRVSFRIDHILRCSVLDDVRKLQEIIKENPLEMKNVPLDKIFDVYKNEVSIKEENYYLYLLQFALMVGAIQIVEEKNSRRLVAVDKEIDRWSETQYYKILIDYIIANTEYHLKRVINSDVINADYVKNLLKNKMIFEEVAKSLLKALGLKKKQIEKFLMNDFEGLNFSYLNEFIMAESILIKEFIIPFSYYIPIIQPCYLDGLKFNELFDMVIQAEEENEPVEEIIFTSMLIYDLSRLGDTILRSPRRVKYQDVFDKKVDVQEIISMRKQITENPEFFDFWKNIKINDLEDLLKSLEEEYKKEEKNEEKPKKKFHKEGNVIHLFKKD
ncbi:hypothetical protein ABG79_01379 [Caloramator mitchellensis]|uniref:Uncharacterized protein n=1 Tax=Caloramator mitchellensis TaxID=908809 RepID=A0A0R3JTS9_CALMK|nr:hypothetical protein [Caloramator mitchellensis]KRQ86888.1 hypothetical protein ABG79_01379 [Caloramator mitchellensis]